jgi:hypothetical protein
MSELKVRPPKNHATISPLRTLADFEAAGLVHALDALGEEA